MKNILMDVKPLVALFDKDDSNHSTVASYVKEKKIHTTTAVATQVNHLLASYSDKQCDFERWLERGKVTIIELNKIKRKTIENCLEKHKSTAKNFSDASLLFAAEELKLNEIVNSFSDEGLVFLSKDEYAQSAF